MLTLGLTGRIWVCLQPQDGRKGIDSLAAVVTTHLAATRSAATCSCSSIAVGIV